MFQLVLLFLLAAALGAALGWSIRGGGARHSVERLDQEWAERLGACEAECRRLRAELEAAGVARAAAQADLEGASARLEDLRRREGPEPASSSGELERLRTDLAAARDRIAVLEDDLVEAREARAEAGSGPAGGELAPLLEDAAAGAPPLRLDAPQGRPDDLKRINGIGPGTERTLNGLGIYHFRQIAELSPENVAWIDRHLRFKGRIAREDWVGQAKVLAGGGESGRNAS